MNKGADFRTFIQEVQMPSWHAIANAVQSIDDVKIKDCKEDVDTLLVFAGLFSAVMTSFIIESYTFLQTDSGSEIASLLRQIVAANYTISANHVNSTVPIPATFASDPPPWALRINELWFASLICSLATASVGMLVKQWLKEYAAFARVSPRERLQVRQFRNPGLSTWMVLEIAAALPILLQISLGLFFIGLCFFTAAVDPRLGRSSLFLVNSWAFFVLMTVVAPLFSPRCPFKLPLLKGLTKGLRNYVVRPLCSQFIGVRLDKEEEDIVATLSDDIQILLLVDKQMADDGMLRLMVNHLSESGRPPSDIVAFVHTVIDNRLRPALQPTKSGSLSDLRILSRPAWEALVDILADALRDWYQGGSGTDSKWAEEVVHLLLSTSQYLLPTVSPSIRALLESDAQLCIVLDTAERTHVDPETVINFLFLVINHRAHSLDPDDCARTPQLPLKLHTFSEPALASICSMLAGALSSNVSRADYRSMPAWAYNALLLLLSDFPLPSDPGHISRALLTCLDDADLWSDQARETMKCRTGRELAERIYGDRPLYPLSIRLLCPLNDMSPSTSAGPSHTSFLVNVLQFYSSVLLRKLGSNLPETRPLWSILRSNPELFENSSARPILNDLWDFLRESSRLYLEKLATRVVVGFEDVFRATLEFGMRHPDVKVQEAVQELWRDVARNGESDIVRFHLTLLTATRRRARLADSLQHLAAPVELLQPIASELELRSVRRYSEDLEELDHVKLCSLCLELYKAELTLRGERDGALAQDRTSLWLDLAGCLDGYRERIHSGGWPIRREQKYWHDPTCPAETLRQLLDQDRIWADQCMKLIRELEAGIFRAGQPKASIPDKLKAAISYFATSDSGLASSSTLI